MGRRPLSTLLGALKPTFNAKTQQWERAKDDDGKYPYDAVGALLRHGPSPFITRIVNAKEYEQVRERKRTCVLLVVRGVKNPATGGHNISRFFYLYIKDDSQIHGSRRCYSCRSDGEHGRQTQQWHRLGVPKDGRKEGSIESGLHKAGRETSVAGDCMGCLYHPTGYQCRLSDICSSVVAPTSAVSSLIQGGGREIRRLCHHLECYHRILSLR